MRPAPRSSSRRVPAASRVDLPEPGTPVTRVRPRRRSQASTISSSMPSSSKLGGAPGSTRSVMLTANPPAACTGARLQRKRRKTPRASATAWEQSMARPAAQDAFARGIEDARAQAAERDPVERRAGRPRQPAVDLDEGGRAGLEGDVGSAAFRRPQQEGVEPFNRKHMRRLRPICVGARGHRMSPPTMVRHALVSRLNAARLSSRTVVSPIRSRRSWPVAAV